MHGIGVLVHCFCDSPMGLQLLLSPRMKLNVLVHVAVLLLELLKCKQVLCLQSEYASV